MEGQREARRISHTMLVVEAEAVEVLEEEVEVD